MTLPAAAMQFPFCHPAVASVLTGARSVAELEANVTSFEVPLPWTLWGDIDDELTAVRTELGEDVSR